MSSQTHSKFGELLRRSALKALNKTSKGLRMEIPLAQRNGETLVSLTRPGEAGRMLVGSDGDIGGHSWARLREPTAERAYTTFYGRTSHLLPSNRPEVARVGYAAFRSPDPEMNIFGRDYWDTGLYRYLSIRARLPKGAPARHFMVNVQTAGVVKTDLFQHRLYLRPTMPKKGGGESGDGEWKDIVIPWSFFVLTNNGRMLAQQMDLFRARVRSVGISLADGPMVEGPFALDIAWFRMWNSPTSNGDMERIYF